MCTPQQHSGLTALQESFLPSRAPFCPPEILSALHFGLLCFKHTAQPPCQQSRQPLPGRAGAGCTARALSCSNPSEGTSTPRPQPASLGKPHSSGRGGQRQLAQSWPHGTRYAGSLGSLEDISRSLLPPAAASDSQEAWAPSLLKLSASLWHSPCLADCNCSQVAPEQESPN